jgi:ParB family transcriptional regulator, chromosome partitioning protein
MREEKPCHMISFERSTPDKTIEVDPSDVEIGKERLRALRSIVVAELAKSMERLGLLQPIVVRPSPLTAGSYVLIGGLHRLEAARKLKWKAIAAKVIEGGDLQAQLAEIAENLHRADLTAAERAAQINLWRKLTEEQKGEQIAPPGGVQPRDTGIKATARALGISKEEVQRAAKIDSITLQAKNAAAAAGLKAQSDLLKIASYPPADQVDAVAEIVAKKAKAKEDRRIEADKIRFLEKAETDGRSSAARIADKYIDPLPAPLAAQHSAAVPEVVDVETPEQTERRIFLSFAADAIKAADMALSDLAKTPVKDEAYIGEMGSAADKVVQAWQIIRSELEGFRDKLRAKAKLH